MNELDGRIGLTETAIDGIRDRVSVGINPELAAEFEGIPRKNFRNYMKDGELDISNGAKNSICAKLWLAVAKGRERFVTTATAQLIKAGERDWKALSFLMGKADPEHFGDAANAPQELEEVKIVNDLACESPEPLPEPSDAIGVKK